MEPPPAWGGGYPVDNTRIRTFYGTIHHRIIRKTTECKDTPMNPRIRLWVIAFTLFCATASASLLQENPVIIGIDADISTAAAQAGEAIYRGAALAVSEINARGGFLGRPAVLEIRDHRGNPARGVANMEAFAAMPDLLAVIGGTYTPVVMEQLPIIHRHGIPFLLPWAAGTRLVENGYSPNYVFRVSVRDEDAGAFLIKKLFEAGYRRPGLLLEQTEWGRSNEKSIMAALRSYGLTPAEIQWFYWGVPDLRPHMEKLANARADVILLVSQSNEGLTAIKALQSFHPRQRLPLISHWGITKGEFPSKAGTTLMDVELFFLQTFSFIAPPFPDRAHHLFDLYRQKFPEIKTPEDIPVPAGTAHAYDLVHLLAKAVAKVGALERSAVRDALENLDHHGGVIRNYRPPFTRERHDALGKEDFHIACFSEKGVIRPCFIRPKD